MPKIICLMGPTASGKTDLAIKLTQLLPCDIISVDSALVYRGMDIGTAKPTPDILKLVPHRLIDIRDPAENYSAADFCADAKREIQAIVAKGRIPLLVGGTMLYFRALQQGLAMMPAADEHIRAKLEALHQLHGAEYLHAKLQAVDPIAAARIHVNDPQRVQRALEIYELTGQPISKLQQHNETFPADWQFINFGLLPSDRQQLHNVIAKRFDAMLEQGFLSEVEKLYARSDLSINKPSIRAVGYRQAWEFLAGNIDETTMREKALTATRQLAKRQMTWLRSWPNLTILESNTENLSQEILHIINLSQK